MRIRAPDSPDQATFCTIPSSVMEDESLDCVAQALYARLAHNWFIYARNGSVDGCMVSTGMRELKRRLRTSQRNVEGAIQLLVSRGHIAVVQTHPNARTWYVLKHPRFGGKAASSRQQRGEPYRIQMVDESRYGDE